MSSSRCGATPPIWLLLASVLVMLLIGCGANEDAFRERVFQPPGGIVRTNAQGDVVDWPDGEMDWETSPRYIGIVNIEPVYPNPSSLSDLLRIPVTVRSGRVPGGLHIELVRGDVITRIATFPHVDTDGFYVMDFDAALFGDPGLYRIYITDGPGDIVSYGDVLIE